MGLKVNGGQRDGMWERGQSMQSHGAYSLLFNLFIIVQQIDFCFDY